MRRSSCARLFRPFAAVRSRVSHRHARCHIALLVVVALASTGCARTSPPTSNPAPRFARVPPSGGASASHRPLPRLGHDAPIRRGGGTYKVGSPYQIAGQWYVPREDRTYDRVGVASWYGRDFHGKATANGETFDMTALTAAHPTLPIPSYAAVTNLANGRTLLVRINDRGPYVPGRMIDLSRRAAELLGFDARGTTAVRVRYVGPAPLDGDETRETAFLLAQPWSRSAMVAPPGPLRRTR